MENAFPLPRGSVTVSAILNRDQCGPGSPITHNCWCVKRYLLSIYGCKIEEKIIIFSILFVCMNAKGRANWMSFD